VHYTVTAATSAMVINLFPSYIQPYEIQCLPSYASWFTFLVSLASASLMSSVLKGRRNNSLSPSSRRDSSCLPRSVPMTCYRGLWKTPLGRKGNLVTSRCVLSCSTLLGSMPLPWSVFSSPMEFDSSTSLSRLSHSLFTSCSRSTSCTENCGVSS
jgi:hypothetical protein